jgi:hypothetical protein
MNAFQLMMLPADDAEQYSFLFASQQRTTESACSRQPLRPFSLHSETGTVRVVRSSLFDDFCLQGTCSMALFLKLQKAVFPFTATQMQVAARRGRGRNPSNPNQFHFECINLRRVRMN